MLKNCEVTMKRRDFLRINLAAAAAAAMGLKTTRAVAAQPNASAAGGIVDAYSHFSFIKVIDYLEEKGGQKPHVFRSLFANTPTLIEPGRRLELMDRLGISRSVLVPLPWLETSPAVHADPRLCQEAAGIFNDALAATVARRTDRLTGVALLPTTNSEIMVAEFERAVRGLKFAGGMFVVGPTAKPPDHPDYEPLYRKAAELNAALWIHPSRPALYPDYVGEKMSQFQVWQGLSWLLDSSTAMVRLVFNGLFDRYPGIKIVIHHHGALIPLFAQRLQYVWDYFEQNTGVRQPTTIRRPYIEHFKKFYIDTATQGNEPLLLQMAVNFFGVERVLFGSDCPMDATAGVAFTTDAIRSVNGLQATEAERALIFSGNAGRVLKTG